MIARRIGWACVLSALIAPFSMACAANGSPSAADGGVTSSRDTGAAIDVGLGVARPDSGVDAGAEADNSNPAAYASQCLDGLDQNGGDGVDCSDPSCSAAASCCVGASTTTCCTIAMPVSAYHFVCSTAPCDTLADFATFGDVGPIQTSDGAFSPESDHGTDSGGILARELDPRSSIVVVTATLGVPGHSDDVDAIGVGLVTSGASAHMVPLAAVVVSAARGQILLLLGESVAGAAMAPVDGMLHEYTISLDPMGTVTVTYEGGTLTASVPLPSEPVHAAFFGRATNPSSGTVLPARIGSLTISASGCDQPAALTRLGGVTLIDHTGAAMLDTAADPSLATDGTHTVLAFTASSMASTGSAIFVATREMDGAFHVRAPASGTQPILAPSSGESLESPALTFASGAWSMYGTRVHAGTRSIFVSVSSTADVLTLGAPQNIATPELTGDVSSPAPIPGSPGQLIVRHVASPSEPTGAHTELAMLTLGGAGATPTNMDFCGADSACVNGARAQTYLYAARTGTISFDADDVDDPAIVFYDHVYRLYYAGRLGSRWSIGMLIAADLGYWRAANDGAAVLAADGTGFDAVSVRGPAPLVEAGRVSLYYVGDDGDARTIALAQGGTVPN